MLEVENRVRAVKKRPSNTQSHRSIKNLCPLLVFNSIKSHFRSHDLGTAELSTALHLKVCFE